MPDTIEAEVLEIDGSPPPVPQEQPRPEARRGDPAWRALRAGVMRLDRRWWPLWLLLGIVLLTVLLVLGLVFGVLLLVAKLVGGMLRLLTGSGGGGTGLSKPFS